MTTIGAAWLKQNKNGEYYYSLSFDREIQPFTITADKRLVLKENKNKDKNEKAPDFFIEVFIPEMTEGKKNLQDPNIKKAAESDFELENEEIPF